MAEVDGSVNASSAPPRKYRRPAHSCEPCRKRKVKCDLQTPCTACQIARAPLACTYREDTINATQRHTVNDSSVPGPDGFETTERAAKRQRLPSDGEVLFQQLDIRLSQLEKRVADERELGNGNGTGTATAGHESIIPTTVPRLRHTQDKVKLFPSSHWIHTAEKLKLSDFGDEDVELSFVDHRKELSDSIQECRNLRRAIKLEQGPQINDPVLDMLSGLPSRDTCDLLAGHYFRTFEVIYRVFHIPSYWKEYEQCWSQPSASTGSFTVKLRLVLAVGLTFCADGEIEEDVEQLRRISRNWIQAAQWWLVGPSEKSTNNLDGIQISCLLLLARQVTSASPSPWLSESSLLQRAMSMGLHRDPKLFHISAFQTEIRTRLWSTVLELVVHGCMNHSTPLLLSPVDFDDHITQNISDANFGPETKQLPPPKPTTEFTESSIQILMRKSLPIRMQAAKLVQNLHREHSHDQAIDLATRLQSVCHDVAAYCRLNWSQALTMHQDFLDMQFRRYILVLHRPFMLRVRQDPRFHISQKMCLESAMIIASYTAKLKLPSPTLDDLSRLMIMSTGSFRGPLTLEIITILSLYMINELEDSSSNGATVHPSLAGAVFLDPLAEMTRAQQEPLLRTLEHIKEQLLEIIKLGHPNLKRYVFLAGVLAQVRAMETGQSVQAAVVKTAKECLKECYSILQSFRSSEIPPDLLEDLDYGDPLGFDFGALDSNLLDLPSFLLGSV